MDKSVDEPSTNFKLWITMGLPWDNNGIAIGNDLKSMKHGKFIDKIGIGIWENHLATAGFRHHSQDCSCFWELGDFNGSPIVSS